MNREQFEHEFHSRTLAYQPKYRTDTRPVVVHLGPQANTPAGHVLLLSLVNQLARAHQHLIVTGITASPLLCPAPFGLATVEDAAVRLARAINPFITMSVDTRATDALTTIAIGATDAVDVELRVGCDGWCATFGTDARVGTTCASTPGAMLAACIAAGFAFHRLLGPTSKPRRSYSLWNYGTAGDAQGPAIDGPLDIGRVLQVGAGGVGAALDFWLALLGVTGAWTICDGDLVDVSNLNRQLAFLATHAGFPNLTPANKATAAAALLGPAVIGDPHWYGDSPAVVDREYDVVLALANEHGARRALQLRLPPILLQATTSTNWEAQFHRHVAGLDDCIPCRHPGAPATLRCAHAEVDARSSTDAALPFLSGTAGLLLLAGLLRLQHTALATNPRNFMSVNLADGEPLTLHLRRNCDDGCANWASEAIRQRIGASTRYAGLDPARRRRCGYSR